MEVFWKIILVIVVIVLGVSLIAALWAEATRQQRHDQADNESWAQQKKDKEAARIRLNKMKDLVDVLRVCKTAEEEEQILKLIDAIDVSYKEWGYAIFASLPSEHVQSLIRARRLAAAERMVSAAAATA